MGRFVASATPQRRFGQTDDEWLAELAQASQREDVIDGATRLAMQMVRWVNIQNAKSWREAASRSTRPQMLYSALRREMAGVVGSRVEELVRDNARLISSIPYEVSLHLTGEIARAQQTGARAETIAKIMRERFPRLTHSRVTLIARTETSKASTELTRARAEELELDWFIWRTSKDRRVRESHRHMEAVMCSWRELPSPERIIGERDHGEYAPGDIYNCRCFPEVVLNLNDVRWPHRVYTGGRIQSMTRHQFEQSIGIQREIAA
jgi:SPP1 gp7 family putative phage head morphogenesis protein